MADEIPLGGERRQLLLTGLVQGVGFRPFVAKLATELKLAGKVRNTGRGVEIDVFGTKDALDHFAARLLSDAPPMAQILSLSQTPAPIESFPPAFTIEASRVDPFASVIIPPDIATCAACERELLDPGDRRFRYPFINCTNCGPRWSIIEAIPYDRPATSMKGFVQCEKCQAEYENPSDRRFHAQPNACPACGPQLSATWEYGHAGGDKAVELAAKVLCEGGIVALMGLGGLHLACDAANDVAVSTLRNRKRRKAKPLAVMAADMEAAGELAVIDEETARLLTSPEAPIVLCPAKTPSPLAASVAPGQAALGVFLPYTPLHKLLFAAGAPRFLVMTSGNRSDEPIISDNPRAREELSSVADLFLLHDRPIIHPVDDSVVKIIPSVGPTLIRRSRGYAPKPFRMPGVTTPILAVGAELLNTVTLAREGLAYVGPHAGDLKNPETEEAFLRTISHLQRILRVEPEIIACDLHPGYISSRYAAEREDEGVRVIRVQHHEAHAAACMAENGHFEGDALALVLDGLGLGRDDTLWGGELFAGSPGDFRRIGHLRQVRQPGGDAASREPWRMAGAWLRVLMGPSWTAHPLPALADHRAEELIGMEAMMKRGVNSPLTSSCGRLFDCAAALLGFKGRMDYTAQAPMELEALAARATAARPYPIAEIVNENAKMVLDPSPIVEALAKDALSGADRGQAALGFHLALADSLLKLVELAAQRENLSKVFLSGGCLQNGILASRLVEGGRALGLEIFAHRHVPPNDGGVSLGQALIAAKITGAKR